MIDMIKKEPYAENYHEVKPSLFRESENLDRLLQALFDVCYSQQVDLIWMAENLLNLDEAYGSHLDFIGGIVGQPRLLIDFNTEPYFGFDKSYQSKTFGSATDPEVGGYWNSRSYFNTATSRKLNDDEYRRLIKARTIYNSSNCTANDLLEVINLITNSTNNTVQLMAHGLIQIKTDDTSGILSYFVDRLYIEDNILPIAAGVRVGLEEVGESEGGGVSDTDWVIEKVYSNTINGSKVDIDAKKTVNNIPVISSITVTTTPQQVTDRILSLDYGAEVSKAVLELDPEATNWVLDTSNSRIKYTLPFDISNMRNTSGSLLSDELIKCNNSIGNCYYEKPTLSGTTWGMRIMRGDGYGGYTVGYVENIPIEKYLSLNEVSNRLILNAENGDVLSKNLLLSIVSDLASVGFYDNLFQ